MSNIPVHLLEHAVLNVVSRNPTTLGLEIGGVSISNTYTIAEMPDATAVEAGTVINIPRSEFTTSTALDLTLCWIMRTMALGAQQIIRI